VEERSYSKQQLLTMLKDVFDQWEELLAGMSEAQIAATDLDDGWSIKDVIAHLWGWQQRSVARSVAALSDSEPQYPGWPEELGSDPDEDGDVDKTNDWIYKTNRERSWTDVYEAWKRQFLRLLELSAQIPENDMLATGRYTWMGDYTLGDSLLGTYEHHAEHIDTVRAHLRQARES
jgi:hypothetical protein